MNAFKTSLRWVNVLLFGILMLAIQVNAAPPAIESFFKNPAFNDAVMSPNGRFVALRYANGDRRLSLVVLNLETMQPKTVASFEDDDIAMFHWINDERLIFNLADLRSAKADKKMAPGLYAVNRDGSAYKQLVERQPQFIKTTLSDDLLPWNTFYLNVIGKRDTDEVWVQLVEGYGKSVNTFSRVQRLNTRTGRVAEIDTPTYSNSWLFDQTGTLRIVETLEGTQVAVRYNDPVTGKWKKLLEFPLLFPELEVSAIGPDNTLYVVSHHGRDKAALYRYDLEHDQIMPTAIMASDDYDIHGGLIFDDNKLLGVRYLIDAEVTTWFDADMAAIQKTVDVLLPKTTNRIERGSRSETPYVVVDAFSDVQPHVFLLYNTVSKKLSKLGMSHADIDPKQMAQMDMIHYPARDGMVIPAYLTIPAGVTQKNLPMVVLVHGGPWVRGGNWNWNPEVQFLASRGYVVLQPEPRGSTGFGDQHFKAGWKQWGLSMQDDIADGAKWAIAQGIADPKRICIAGASYGGYATLMGLARDAELFRCGINWVGVTDINLMYSVGWSDATDLQKYVGMPVLIGDQVKDAVQLKATSPLEQAGRIKQPLLLAYGGYDERVPMVHGEKFYAAVKAGNPDVEWVVYPDEGHGWELVKTRVDFWSRVEKFLDRYIGKP